MTRPALGINPPPYEQASRNAPIRTFSVSKGPDGRTLDAAIKKSGPHRHRRGPETFVSS